MNKVTVEALRKSGYKVRVMHERFIESDGLRYLRPQREIPGIARLGKGGKTTIELTTPDGKNASAEARCNMEDSFNRKLGVQICLGRIAKQVNLN